MYLELLISFGFPTAFNHCCHVCYQYLKEPTVPGIGKCNHRKQMRLFFFVDQCCSGKGDMSDEDDENEFFDAPEIITMPENLGHK